MNTEMCYVGRKPGFPGYCAIVMDDGVSGAATAAIVASFVRDGYEVERVTRDLGVAGWQEYIAARDGAAITAATPTPVQQGLFDVGNAR